MADQKFNKIMQRLYPDNLVVAGDNRMLASDAYIRKAAHDMYLEMGGAPAIPNLKDASSRKMLKVIQFAELAGSMLERLYTGFRPLSDAEDDQVHEWWQKASVLMEELEIGQE